jgi:hypothetical protein
VLKPLPRKEIVTLVEGGPIIEPTEAFHVCEACSGRYLAHAGYNSGQAEAEIWRAAWERYPNDRFFARCFAQEAEQTYADTIKKVH